MFVQWRITRLKMIQQRKIMSTVYVNLERERNTLEDHSQSMVVS
jgi:hypothetical protein